MTVIIFYYNDLEFIICSLKQKVFNIFETLFTQINNICLKEQF